MARRVSIDDTLAVVNRTVQQGDDWSWPFTFTQSGTALNVSTYTWVATVRPSRGSVGTTLVPITVNTAQAATGIIVLEASDADTGITAGTYWWELEWLVGGIRRTVLGGELTVVASTA